MDTLCSGIKCKKIPNSSDARQVKMSRLANTTNMIMKGEILVKTTPRSLTLDDGNTCKSPTLLDKSLKFCFKSGDRNIINSLLESLIFNIFLIIHTRISEIHMFNFVNDSNGSLHSTEL